MEKKSKIDTLFANPPAAVVLAVTLNMLWGCAFPFIKVGYALFSIEAKDLASILLFAGTRFSVSGAAVLLIGSLMQRRPLLPPRGKLGLKVLGLGLWQTTFQYFFYYLGVANLTGKTGSVLNATTSFMAVILAHFLYGNADRMTLRKALGCAIGFSGVVLACLSPDNGGTPLGIFAILTAAVALACSNPMNKSICRECDSFTVSGWNLLYGGVALLALGALGGGHLAFSSPLAFADMGALCFISGAGFTMNALLLKNNPVSRVAVFGLCIPITTNLVSALLYPGSYTLGPVYLMALGLVCFGIVLVTRPGHKKAPL